VNLKFYRKIYFSDTEACQGGLTEIAGLDIDGRVKQRGWTLQDWTMADRTLTDGYLYHQKSNNKLYETFAHIEFNAK